MSSPAGDDEANEVACPQEATRLKSPKQDAQAAVFLMVYHVRSGSSVPEANRLLSPLGLGIHHTAISAPWQTIMFFPFA